MVPALTDLRLQVLHTEDAVSAYVAAIRGAVHRPINLAADPQHSPQDALAKFLTGLRDGPVHPTAAPRHPP
ncbi:hypothetical protein ACFTZB_10760 [Rhodococcus sp. NPDC057014]|uniref:hypothetical protein n=1 Tax=Rhodococcus sp. NPDC057014 TaxID=3346000 RepID=UPI00363446A1